MTAFRLEVYYKRTPSHFLSSTYTAYSGFNSTKESGPVKTFHNFFLVSYNANSSTTHFEGQNAEVFLVKRIWNDTFFDQILFYFCARAAYYFFKNIDRKRKK